MRDLVVSHRRSRRWPPTSRPHAGPQTPPLQGTLLACATPQFGAANRHDPFWEELFDLNGNASWFGAARSRAQLKYHQKSLPKDLAGTKKEGLDAFFSKKYWTIRVAMLGALHGWRTLSMEQMAAMTGSSTVIDGRGKTMASAFAAELIDIGEYVVGRSRLSLRERGGLIQPSNSSTFEKKIVPRLTKAEWISITAGQKWSNLGLHDRHNILATELGLRLAEFAPIGTVMSERFSKVDYLAGSGIGREPLTKNNRSADLAIVRPDGMRIAVELVASVSPAFKKKVAYWARLLAERPFETSGLCVMFVCVGGHDRSTASATSGRSAVYRAVLDALREFPGSPYDPVAERMGVTSWREWFPSHKTAHEGFTAMRADAPVGHLIRSSPGIDYSTLTADQIWKQLDFLDPESRPFQPDPSFDATAVIDNSRLLGQTPVWLRKDKPVPNIWLDIIAPEGIVIPEGYNRRTKEPGRYRLFVDDGHHPPPKRLLGINTYDQLDRSLVRPAPPKERTFYRENALASRYLHLLDEDDPRRRST